MDWTCLCMFSNNSEPPPLTCLPKNHSPLGSSHSHMSRLVCFRYEHLTAHVVLHFVLHPAKRDSLLSSRGTTHCSSSTALYLRTWQTCHPCTHTTTHTHSNPHRRCNCVLFPGLRSALLRAHSCMLHATGPGLSPAKRACPQSMSLVLACPSFSPSHVPPPHPRMSLVLILECLILIVALTSISLLRSFVVCTPKIQKKFLHGLAPRVRFQRLYRRSSQLALARDVAGMA